MAEIENQIDGFIGDIIFNMDADEIITAKAVQQIIMRDYYSLEYITETINALKAKGVIEDAAARCDKTADLFEVA